MSRNGAETPPYKSLSSAYQNVAIGVRALRGKETISAFALRMTKESSIAITSAMVSFVEHGYNKNGRPFAARSAVQFFCDRLGLPLPPEYADRRCRVMRTVKADTVQEKEPARNTNQLERLQAQLEEEKAARVTANRQLGGLKRRNQNLERQLAAQTEMTNLANEKARQYAKDLRQKEGERLRLERTLDDTYNDSTADPTHIEPAAALKARGRKPSANSGANIVLQIQHLTRQRQQFETAQRTAALDGITSEILTTLLPSNFVHLVSDALAGHLDPINGQPFAWQPLAKMDEGDMRRELLVLRTAIRNRQKTAVTVGQQPSFDPSRACELCGNLVRGLDTELRKHFGKIGGSIQLVAKGTHTEDAMWAVAHNWKEAAGGLSIWADWLTDYLRASDGQKETLLKRMATNIINLTGTKPALRR